MSVLVRVDDRLVHGQVVVGWGRALKLRHVVLVDDAIAASTWEQDLYRMGVPDGMRIDFVAVADARTRFREWDAEGSRTMVLVTDIDVLSALADAAPVQRVNLGGIHQAPGRTERLSYVFLSSDEAEQLRTLAERGLAITAQDVPTARPVPLAEILK
jgi:PTS system mannose-specific IIB component/fructoselysine and glucoselysine-specific PTS system IIB component